MLNTQMLFTGIYEFNLVSTAGVRFRKITKATIIFVMSVCLSIRPSVCLSVCMEQLGSHWTDFHENLCLFS